VDHLESCDVCDGVSRELDPSVLPFLFEFLADMSGDVTADEQSYLEKLLADLTDEERAIETAITKVLLPSLSQELKEGFDERRGEIPLLSLFAAIEAVGLAVRRILRDPDIDAVRLTKNGDVCSHEVIAGRKVLSLEILEMAEISEAQADWLLLWICQAVRCNRRLFLGMDVVNATDQYVLLKTHKRVDVLELPDWWKVPASVGAAVATSKASHG